MITPRQLSDHFKSIYIVVLKEKNEEHKMGLTQEDLIELQNRYVDPLIAAMVATSPKLQAILYYASELPPLDDAKIKKAIEREAMPILEQYREIKRRERAEFN